MFRYEEGSDKLIEVFFNVMEERFGEMQSLKFKLLFDNKKKVTKGKLVLASVEVPGEKLKYFTIDKISVEGYDFILIVDKKAFELASDADRARILSHELQHVVIDEENKCKTIGHDVSDFYDEIERNALDPRWGDKLASRVLIAYSEEKNGR